MPGSAVFRIGAAPGPWVRNPLWRNARAVPSLDLQFADNKSLVDGVTGQNPVTFTRASTGTYVGSDGLIKSATTNEARFDHNPTTGESLGLLVEEARTNLLLNSATLSTQSVTVAAASNTLSFYGTGTVTLTGVSTAGPLVGTGANNRVSLTFTPTVGVLVLTVSGSVTNAQLEAGASSTSYIPTTSATATRAADVVSITGTNFSSWYNQTQGTVYLDGARPVIDLTRRFATFHDGTSADQLRITGALSGSSARPDWQIFDNSSQQANVAGTVLFSANQSIRFAGTYALNDFQQAAAGSLGIQDTLGTVPTIDRVSIGATESNTSIINGTIKRLAYWPLRLTNTTLQQVTQ